MMYNTKVGERMKRGKFAISYMICQGCGNEFPIPRKKSSKRNKGHIKDLYCPFCSEIKKMVEVRDKDCYKNALGELVG